MINVSPDLGELIGTPGYHPLLAGSPAINAGNPAGCTGSSGALTTDQRGAPRVGTCDIGAYEYTAPGAPANVLAVSAPQRTPPNTPFMNPLKAAVVDSLGSPVSGVTVTFTAPGSGGSGTFANTGNAITTATSNTSGVATTSAFKANGVPGSYIVSATASGIPTPASLSLNNIAWFVATTGSDANDCLSSSTPCATINTMLGKPGFQSNDGILVASGTYTGSGNEVILINKGVRLFGGWNIGFTLQSGISTIDGQGVRRGVTVISAGITATIERFKIQNGVNTGYPYAAGGISNMGVLVLNNATVSGNTSNDFGGGIFNGGTLTLENSTVSGNSVNGSAGGGGIYNGGTLTLKNSTVSGNMSTYNGGGGGGIYNGSTLTLNNSTVIGNTSNYYGGGIYLSYGGTVTLNNSLLAGNSAVYSGPDCSGSISSNGYNLIGNNSGCTFTSTTGDLVGTSASPIRPKLNALQDNGGPTFTHALGIGSPAIDAGNPATCLATDQRGVARPVGAKCDIGAYEGSVPYVPSMPYVDTYTANNSSSLPGTFRCNQTDPACGPGDDHAKAAHKYAIGTYNLYATQHLRDSIDNNGMTIISTVRYSTGYDNAYWSGTQMVYGDAHGWPLADDIVAHELTHGVTEYESNLFYYYQSGAINESFSDLWGEYYDQTNGQGNDGAGVKWLMGEDISGLGAIRSMSNPPAYGDPDKMTSPNYYTGSDDNGGVHWNSGVNNKAVYLMVDGGSFNGKTVTALGWEKTGAIYYEAQTNLLTSASDYSDLYLALQQACTNLIGQHGITTGDCTQVMNALDAVEMNKRQPFGNLEDPSFEHSFATYPYWDQYSTNWGSPLCTIAWCTSYGGTAGPRTGSVWGLLGGTTEYEVAALSQTVYFSDGYPSRKLKFYLWIGMAQAGSDANDRFVVDVDGVTVFTANATQKSWYPTYTLVTVDLSSFATNAMHTITFYSVTNGQIVNFNIDDVSLADESLSISGNAGQGGVVLSYVQNGTKTVTADGSGNYSITVPYGWSGMVTPSKYAYTFSPASITYSNVSTNLTGQNYTATYTTRTISGNAGMAGTTMSYVENGAKTVTADGSGNYSITVPHGWSGTVTPSLNGDAFCPASKTYTNLTANQPAQNYIHSACPQFTSFGMWTTDYNYDAQSWRVSMHPRVVGDVNGDGKDDLIGFGYDGVWIALSNGSSGTGGSFTPIKMWTTDYSYIAQSWRTELHPRMTGDVNGDGKDDLIGFGYDGVWIALSNGGTAAGGSFTPIKMWTTDYSYIAQGWRVESYPRMVGDVNGDGKDDLIGFGHSGVWIALSTGGTAAGGSFTPIKMWTTDYNYDAQSWRVSMHPRVVGDVNGDGKDDLIGFGYDGVWIALSNGGTAAGGSFTSIKMWTTDYS